MARPAKHAPIAVYLRVSTAEQAASGLGLDAQRDRCRAYAEALGLAEHGIRWFEDAGESAGSMSRPALQDLLSAVDRREVSAVIVLKIDRLSRSVADLRHLVERFERRSVAFHSVSERVDTGSAAGRLFLTLLGSFAEFEREQAIERTREAVRAKRTRGFGHGFERYGEKHRGVKARIQACEPELRAIDLMVERREAGASLREIARELTAKGFQTKRGGRWQASTVMRILARQEAA